MVVSAIAGIFIVAVVCGVGLSAASADSSDDLARAGGFGFDSATQTATAATQISVPNDEPAPQAANASSLAEPSQRTIDAGLKMIDEREKAQREREAAQREADRKRLAEERKAQEERARAERAAAIERVQANRAMQGVVGVAFSPDEQTSVDGLYEYDLPAVNWSVGKDAFIGEWTSRIDAYLAGSPLSGYGYAFAEAAWDNGVDPRWSPAISNTESSKGSVCFLPCNAWGWGNSSWGDWDTAIRAHVAGLAEVYGYCVTPSAAAVYCPPNCDYWYSTTVGQMASI